MDFYRILLVHGFYKDSSQMMYLAEQLTKAGFRVDNLNLPLTYEDIEESEKILKRKIQNIKNDRFSKAKEIVLIGFGLGGVLLRKVIQNDNWDNEFIKLILICSPAREPKIVTRFNRTFKVLSKIYRPLLILLKENMDTLENPKDMNVGIIRGTEPDRKIFRQLLGEYNDGYFEKDDVTFYDEKGEIEFDTLDIPFGHQEILKRKGTVEYILEFIETGKFIPDKSKK